MSDGELVTRIVAQTIFRVTPHGTEEIVDIGGIRQLIREAKADFPKYPDINQTVSTNDWLTHLDYYDKAVENWFQKWFGIMNHKNLRGMKQMEIEVGNNTKEPILVSICKSTLSGRIYVHLGKTHGNEVLVNPNDYSIITVKEVPC